MLQGSGGAGTDGSGRYGSIGTDISRRPGQLGAGIEAASVSSSIAQVSTGAKRSSTPLLASAKPLGQFTFLEKSYSIKTPSCIVPKINELFKSACDRYDVAVVNREKVDETLTLFKQVVGVEKSTSMEVSFTAWKECLTNPKFTVSFAKETGDVKDVRVRAEVIPRDKRKAQKHIRDLLDCCHLFLQQKNFLQRQIMADITQLEGLSGQLQALGKDCGLSSAERKQLPKTFAMAREQFAGFPNLLDLFFTQVYSLMNEINASIHVLEARESSSER